MNSQPLMRIALPIILAAAVSSLRLDAEASEPMGREPAPSWIRHTIDGSSRGADGVRLADLNGDGRLDIATGWEEGGVVRVYLQPAAKRVASGWPSISVGRVASPEDAVLVDADQDGRLDVISSCEGRNRTMYVHWAPRVGGALGKSSEWRTEAIGVTVKQQSWMFAVPLAADRSGVSIVTGSKGARAAVGLLQTGSRPRDPRTWTYTQLCDAGWIMSLRAVDIDGDGDRDIVFSDRKRPYRGVWWLENPRRPNGTASAEQIWKRHLIGGADSEVMFLDLADLNGDSQLDIVVATRHGVILVFESSGGGLKWKRSEIPNPCGAPHGKAVAIGDIDGDGDLDLVHTVNNHGKREHRGVTWLERRQASGETVWTTHDISGIEGVKFDRIELLDLDGDGDLDVLTCEERNNLGVIWYENPHRS